MSDDTSLEQIAQKCVLDVARNFPGSSFVLLDYDNRTYMGAVRVMDGGDDNSIVKINRLLPAIDPGLADYISHRRPGVVRLYVDHKITLLKSPVFRASLTESSLNELSDEQKRRLVRLESFE